jgi:hypothetical protein
MLAVWLDLYYILEPGGIMFTQKRTVIQTFRTRETIKHLLKAVAVAEKTSVSDLINKLLEEGLKQRINATM